MPTLPSPFALPPPPPTDLERQLEQHLVDIAARLHAPDAPDAAGQVRGILARIAELTGGPDVDGLDTPTLRAIAADTDGLDAWIENGALYGYRDDGAFRIGVIAVNDDMESEADVVLRRALVALAALPKLLGACRATGTPPPDLAAAYEALGGPLTVEYDHDAQRQTIRARILDNNGMYLAGLLEMDVSGTDATTDPQAESLVAIVNAVPGMLAPAAPIPIFDHAAHIAKEAERTARGVAWCEDGEHEVPLAEIIRGVGDYDDTCRACGEENRADYLAATYAHSASCPGATNKGKVCTWTGKGDEVIADEDGPVCPACDWVLERLPAPRGARVIAARLIALADEIDAAAPQKGG